MLKLKKVAVTGGLAAGKTTVCQLLKERGAYVVSADEIVHQILSPETAVGQQVLKLLGSDIVTAHLIDRKKIAEKVFTDPKLLRSLEKIIHPAVFDELEKRYKQIQKETQYTLFVAEIPLLFETGTECRFDNVISVIASPKLCKERFMKGKERLDYDFERRMAEQMAPEHKSMRAHYTIENNGDIEELKSQVFKLYEILT